MSENAVNCLRQQATDRLLAPALSLNVPVNATISLRLYATFKQKRLLGGDWYLVAEESNMSEDSVKNKSSVGRRVSEVQLRKAHTREVFSKVF